MDIELDPLVKLLNVKDTMINFMDGVDNLIIIEVEQGACIYTRDGYGSDSALVIVGNLSNMVEWGSIFEVQAVVNGCCELLIGFGGDFGIWLSGEDEPAGFCREVLGRGEGAGHSLGLLLLLLGCVGLPSSGVWLGQASGHSIGLGCSCHGSDSHSPMCSLFSYLRTHSPY
jgi:hypothetical protein